MFTHCVGGYSGYCCLPEGARSFFRSQRLRVSVFGARWAHTGAGEGCGGYAKAVRDLRLRGRSHR